MISIVLAAGKGTRMKSNISKLMAKANGEPIISIVDRVLKASNISNNIFILGYLKEQILDFMPNIDYVVQSEQLGTAHAIIIAKSKIESTKEDVLVCNGDGPLLKSSTIIKMKEKFEKENYDALLLSCEVSNPYGYGRIYKENNKVVDIVEESEANSVQKLINEVNAGVYMFKRDSLLKIIDKFDNNNSKGEFYITDSVKLLNSLNLKVGSFKIEDENEMLGVNSKSQLAQVSKILRNRKNEELMVTGKYEDIDLENKSVYAYKRVGENGELVVISNFYEPEVEFELEKNGIKGLENAQILLSNYETNPEIKDGKIILTPYESIIFKK